MGNRIKCLFRVALFCLYTILLAGYIETVQATKQEVVGKKILQNRIGAILEAAAKRRTQSNNQLIEVILKENREAQIKLQKLLNLSLKKQKKYFFKLSLEQLQIILPRLQALTSLDKESMVAMEELEKPIEEAFRSMGKVKKEMEQDVPDKAFQKEVEKEIKLEFQGIIKTLQVLRNNPQTVTHAILLANDLEPLCDFLIFTFQTIQAGFLQCSFMQQQFFLPNFKKIRRLLEEHLQIDKELMVVMPDILKKKLQELAKEMSQKVHGMLDSYSQEIPVAAIVAATMV